MSRYKVEFTNSARKSLKALPRQDQIRIATAIELLSENPVTPKSIKLSDRDGYRVRIGKYRIIYQFSAGELTILVIDFGHRREIYLR